MLSVCFAGITGWTAPPLVAAIYDLALTSGVSRFPGRPDLDHGGSVEERRLGLCRRF
jgi:hypothetical protein